MKNIEELEQIVKEGLEFVQAESGVIQAVVYASANRRTVGRLVYTSHIPSNGLEEPKSDEDFGVSVEIWFENDGKKLVGFGQEPNEISLAAIKRCYDKAKRDAVEDPDFYGFLKKEDLFTQDYSVPKNYHDRKLINLSPLDEAEVLAQLSWETVSGAVERIADYAKIANLTPQALSFILNGDNFVIRERMALATSQGFVESDESTIVLSFLTAMLEHQNGKGSAWGARQQLQDFSPRKIGREVAEAAIANINGSRADSGKYTVIFGPQAVAELFGSLLLPHLTLGLVDFGASIYTGKFGQKITSPFLSMADDPTMPDAAGTKRVTDEGAPTKKTELIRNGELVGYLSDYRMMSRILHHEKESTEKIGVDPTTVLPAIAPHNGFRFGLGGGRIAGTMASTSATNLVVGSDQAVTEEELFKKVKNGLYIGRLWYTYPVGGYASGIISGTAIADNFFVRDGQKAEPILPNTLRLEDNIRTMMQNIIGISDTTRPTILWASDEITHAPLVAIKEVNFNQINTAV